MSEQTGNIPSFIIAPNGEYIFLAAHKINGPILPEPAGVSAPVEQHGEHAGAAADRAEADTEPEAKVLRDKRGRFMKRSLANAALHFSEHPHAV